MDVRYVLKELALYSALASLVAELGLGHQDFNAEEMYINLKTVELLEKHGQSIEELGADVSPEEFTKELFMEQAKKVKSLLENMEAEGDL